MIRREVGDGEAASRPFDALHLSPLGFGAAPLGNVYGEIDQAAGIRAVHHAIDRGITFFDVSPYYGLTLAEEVLGVGAQSPPTIVGGLSAEAATIPA